MNLDYSKRSASIGLIRDALRAALPQLLLVYPYLLLAKTLKPDLALIGIGVAKIGCNIL